VTLIDLDDDSIQSRNIPINNKKAPTNCTHYASTPSQLINNNNTEKTLTLNTDENIEEMLVMNDSKHLMELNSIATRLPLYKEVYTEIIISLF
jgi:hypothetical protein